MTRPRSNQNGLNSIYKSALQVKYTRHSFYYGGRHNHILVFVSKRLTSPEPSGGQVVSSDCIHQTCHHEVTNDGDHQLSHLDLEPL